MKTVNHTTICKINIRGIRKITPFAVLIAMVVFISASHPRAVTSIAAAPDAVVLDLSLYATGFQSPVGITNAGDDRLFVIERAGRIRIVQSDGSLLESPFLDITERVDSSSSEKGLLGLEFHPDFQSNGYFYVNYTNRIQSQTQTRISRFELSDDMNVANEASEEVLLTVDQPQANHNAGDIHFGPDGFLYIPLGDGGGGGDPQDNAQDPGTLLGKITRIDVDSEVGGSAPDCPGNGSGNYLVPASNPFLGEDGYCDEIWALGLRNPWQSSFDRLTGDLFIGDVGQKSWEEVNFQPAYSSGGENYGWRCYEGNHEYNTDGCREIENYTFPIFDYPNPEKGRSVVSGYVYRGSQYPALYGRYVFTDAYSGILWDLVHGNDGWQATEHDYLEIIGIVAFGEDYNGEIYAANIYTGSIYQLTASGLDPWVILPFISKQ